MYQITPALIKSLREMSPNERLKYIRKRIIKKNQDEFCADGTIGISTLKDIERGISKISEKMSQKLIRKLLLCGISCNDDFFSYNPDKLSIKINYDINNKDLSTDINFVTDRIPKLAVHKVENDSFLPYIPKNSLLFFDPVPIKQYISCNNTLCLIKGLENNEIFFITYSDGEINAFLKNKSIILTKEILNICQTHIIEAVFYGYK